MASKQDILDVFDANPDLTSAALAEICDTSPEYVRATLRRNDRRLKRSPGQPLDLASVARRKIERAAAMRSRALQLARMAAKLEQDAHRLMPDGTTQEQNVPPAPTGGDQTVPPSEKPE